MKVPVQFKLDNNLNMHRQSTEKISSPAKQSVSFEAGTKGGLSKTFAGDKASGGIADYLKGDSQLSKTLERSGSRERTLVQESITHVPDRRFQTCDCGGNPGISCSKCTGVAIHCQENNMQSVNGGQSHGSSCWRSHTRVQPVKASAGVESGFELQSSLEKINSNIDHHCHHYDAKIVRKQGCSCNKGLFPDKLETLKDQNINLKSRQKDLEEQIKIIATKLKRQINQLKKDRVVGGKNTTTAKFEQDLDVLIEENVRLQDEEATLMAKVKKLQAKRRGELAQGKNLYSVVEDKTLSNADRQEKAQLRVIETLKETVSKSNKQIMALQNDLAGAKRLQESSINVNDLSKEKRAVELRHMQAQARLEDVKANLRCKQEIFSQGKDYEEGVFQQLKSLQDEGIQLKSQKRSLETTASSNMDIRKRLQEAKQERDRMQAEFDRIMKQPFFQKECNQGAMSKLEDLQTQINQKEKDISQSKATILKYETQTKAIVDETKKLKEERDSLQDDIVRMKSHIDPSSVSLSDIMKKLQNEDPSRFREVMNDLEYDGKDPNWKILDSMDQINQLTGQGQRDPNSLSSLVEQQKRLMEEKAKLATELARTQNLLKLQVDIDKQNSALQQAELNQIQSSIKNSNQKISELNTLMAVRNKKLLTIQQSAGNPGLTQEGLTRFNQEMSSLKKEIARAGDMDALTEFSVMTDESEILPKENLLDLRISTAAFDRTNLIRITGGRELLPGNVNTFLAVDFYNHDSKSTDLSEGFEPIYNTLFSFKNLVDDFYIKFLERDSILIDIFLVSPSTSQNSTQRSVAQKIGSARLPLHKLLEKDTSLQAQEIVHESAEGPIRIGKLFYRMRTRKPLDEALKWYKERKELQGQAANNTSSNTQQASKKIVEVVVEQAYDLKINGQGVHKNIMPFFAYDFYTFEVRSATVPGSNPLFNSVKQFEVDSTRDFEHYMKTETLKIDLIDEGVDLRHTSERDYIGSVRVPLIQVLSKGSFSGRFPVLDEQNRSAGEMAITIRIQDAAKFSYESSFGRTDGKILQGDKLSRMVILAIVTKFAETRFEDIDFLLDMLFVKDSSNQQRVTKAMFKEFIMSDIRVTGIYERDLDVFLKTHDLLHSKEVISRQELKSIFDLPFREARDRMIEQEAHQPKRTQYGTNFEKNAYAQNAPRAGGMDDSFARATTNIGNPFNASSNNFNDRGQDLNVTRQDTASLGLEARIKDKVYEIINDFQTECGVDFPGATIRQTLTVLKKHASNPEEVEQFFKKYAVGDLFYYREQLMFLFARSTKNVYLNKQRSPQDTSNLQSAKNDLFRYCQQKKYSMDDLFAVLDSNKNGQISLQELTKGLKDALKESDIINLFRIMDVDKSNSISKEELIGEFNVVNASLVLEGIRASATKAANGQLNVDTVFKTVDNNRNNSIDIFEFEELVRLAYKSCNQMEIDLLFHIADKQGRGYLTKDDLNQLLSKGITMESKVFVNPIDLILPLQTKIKRRLNLSTAVVFERFGGRDTELNLQEFSSMINYFLGWSLTPEEEFVLQCFIESCAGSSAQKINKTAFEQVLLTTFKYKSLGKGSKTEAEKAFRNIKSQLICSGKQIMSQLASYQSDPEVKNKEISIRNFKIMLHSQFVLPPFAIDNLIEFLDKRTEGFIPTVEIQRHLQ